MMNYLFMYNMKLDYDEMFLSSEAQFRGSLHCHMLLPHDAMLKQSAGHVTDMIEVD